MHGIRTASAIRLALILLSMSSVLADWNDSSSSPDELELIKWVKMQKGAEVYVRVGKECETCMRGLIAEDDVQPAGLLLRLPPAAQIRLAALNHTGFAAEYARELVVRMHVNATFNTTYAAYLKTLPLPSAVFSPEIWSEHHEKMLQTPYLEILAGYSRRSTEQIYRGEYPEYSYPPLAEELGNKSAAVDLQTFKYMSAVVGSRYFGVPQDKTNENVNVLAPLLDMANHADIFGNTSRLNAYQTTYKNALVLRALRPIKKGEEVRFNYQPGVNHRPDMSLLVYGFFQKRNTSSPLLAAVDLPTFSMEEQYAPTPEDDSVFYGASGKFVTGAEVKRLTALLKAAPTTLKQDQALLDKNVTDWRERLLIEFRVERKRALLGAIETINKELKRRKRRKKDEL